MKKRLLGKHFFAEENMFISKSKPELYPKLVESR